jgi:GDP-L-fucose synthase
MNGVQYVFHCAARSSGAAVTESAPVADVTANLLINAQMLEAAQRVGVQKFIWLGSTTAYPLTGSRPVKEEELLNGELYEKYFCVGWEKRMMEILCRMYGEKLSHPITVIILRPTNIYGPNDDFDPKRSRVTAALIRKVVERHNPLEVWGTGEDVRDQIYVDDVIDAMMLAVEKVNGYETFNIGSGKGYTVREILETIQEVDRYTDARIVFNVSKPSMIPIRLVDVTKAKTVLGFTAKTSLRQGLEKAIEWFRMTMRESPV